MSLQWKFMMKRSSLLLVTFFVGIAPTIAQSNKVFHAFYYPYGIVIDSKGSLFVTGKNNKVIKISPSGQVSEFAGSPNGNAGTIDDYGTKASFRDTRGIAIDGQDNLYVCDYNKVRKISPAGLVSTYVGNGNYKQIDGSLATASFNHLHNIATNKNGEMYVTDQLFDEVKKEDYHTIRKISKDGSVTTLRNTDGSPIRINYAGGITCDSEGNLIVCDQRSRCILIAAANRRQSSAVERRRRVSGGGWIYLARLWREQITIEKERRVRLRRGRRMLIRRMNESRDAPAECKTQNPRGGEAA